MGTGRALLAALVFGGLRIDEALSLRWRHVSLPARAMRVVGAKTGAGVRVVDLRPALVDELVEMRARSGGAPDALVFGTATGGKHSPSNVRTRLLAKAVERADSRLAEQDHPPLPEPMTPHSLRRTFASVLLSLGEEVPYVMEQAWAHRSEGDARDLRAGDAALGGRPGAAPSAGGWRCPGGGPCRAPVSAGHRPSRLP